MGVAGDVGRNHAEVEVAVQRQVSQLTEYGAEMSVPIGVQAPPPDGRLSNAALATLEPESAESEETVTEAPGDEGVITRRGQGPARIRVVDRDALLRGVQRMTSAIAHANEDLVFAVGRLEVHATE